MKTLVLVVLAAGCISAQTPAVTDIFRFEAYQGSACNYPQGAFPFNLMQAGNRKFYGTTFVGSSDPNCAPDYYGEGFGTVFDISGATFTSLFSFPRDNATGVYPDGEIPTSGLVQWKNDKLYGTTSNSGPNPSSAGTLYELSLKGAVTVLYTFCFEPGCADGESPNGGVVFGTDGTIYGATGSGGFGFGTIYSLSNGVFQALHLLSELDGANPNGLVLASDGNFYGTAALGGMYNLGTLFRVTTAGAFTVLHNFGDAPTDGVGPAYASQLTQASNGLLYGTTSGSYATGQTSGGTVFSVDLNGNYNKIYDFAHTSLTKPNSLIQASDGFLYGTAQNTTSGAPGWVFRMDVNGGSFKAFQMGTSDVSPSGALVQSIGGKLYGTAQGDINFYPLTSTGTVFSVNLELPPPQPSITLFGPASGSVGTSVTVIGKYFFGITSVEFNGVAATFEAFVPGYLTASVPTGATSGPITIKTAGTFVTSAQVFTVVP
jgi:uncharacterized repeat protein (TIGR03803 family)